MGCEFLIHGFYALNQNSHPAAWRAELPGTLAELEAALAAVERGGRRRGSRSHSAGAIMGR